MSNVDIGKRIKARRLELNMTQGDIAGEIGVAISTIQRYETGSIDKIKLPVLEAIARAIHVSPEWLVGKAEIMAYENIIPMPKMNKVPLVGTIACGEPILATENIECQVDVPSHVHADFALRCKGDSMINARIYDGDIVYIRQQPTVDDGEIAAVLIDDEATLKRVHFYSDHIVLSPENPNYKPLSFWDEDMNSVRILGKAVSFTSLVI